VCVYGSDQATEEAHKEASNSSNVLLGFNHHAIDISVFCCAKSFPVIASMLHKLPVSSTFIANGLKLTSVADISLVTVTGVPFVVSLARPTVFNLPMCTMLLYRI
jgi:hypothetical protein